MSALSVSNEIAALRKLAGAMKSARSDPTLVYWTPRQHKRWRTTYKEVYDRCTAACAPQSPVICKPELLRHWNQIIRDITASVKALEKNRQLTQVPADAYTFGLALRDLLMVVLALGMAASHSAAGSRHSGAPHSSKTPQESKECDSRINWRAVWAVAAVSGQYELPDMCAWYPLHKQWKGLESDGKSSACVVCESVTNSSKSEVSFKNDVRTGCQQYFSQLSGLPHASWHGQLEWWAELTPKCLVDGSMGRMQTALVYSVQGYSRLLTTLRNSLILDGEQMWPYYLMVEKFQSVAPEIIAPESRNIANDTSVDNNATTTTTSVSRGGRRSSSSQESKSNDASTAPTDEKSAAKQSKASRRPARSARSAKTSEPATATVPTGQTRSRAHKKTTGATPRQTSKRSSRRQRTPAPSVSSKSETETSMSEEETAIKSTDNESKTPSNADSVPTTATTTTTTTTTTTARGTAKRARRKPPSKSPPEVAKSFLTALAVSDTGLAAAASEALAQPFMRFLPHWVDPKSDHPQHRQVYLRFVKDQISLMMPAHTHTTARSPAMGGRKSQRRRRSSNRLTSSSSSTDTSGSGGQCANDYVLTHDQVELWGAELFRRSFLEHFKACGTLNNGDLYVAVSALNPEFPMLGLFAGRRFKKGEIVTEYGGYLRDRSSTDKERPERHTHVRVITEYPKVKDGLLWSECFDYCRKDRDFMQAQAQLPTKERVHVMPKVGDGGSPLMLYLVREGGLGYMSNTSCKSAINVKIVAEVRRKDSVGPKSLFLVATKDIEPYEEVLSPYNNKESREMKWSRRSRKPRNASPTPPNSPSATSSEQTSDHSSSESGGPAPMNEIAVTVKPEGHSSVLEDRPKRTSARKSVKRPRSVAQDQHVSSRAGNSVKRRRAGSVVSPVVALAVSEAVTATDSSTTNTTTTTATTSNTTTTNTNTTTTNTDTTKNVTDHRVSESTGASQDISDDKPGVSEDPAPAMSKAAWKAFMRKKRKSGSFSSSGGAPVSVAVSTGSVDKATQDGIDSGTHTHSSPALRPVIAGRSALLKLSRRGQEGAEVRPFKPCSRLFCTAQLSQVSSGAAAENWKDRLPDNWDTLVPHQEILNSCPPAMALWRSTFKPQWPWEREILSRAATAPRSYPKSIIETLCDTYGVQETLQLMRDCHEFSGDSGKIVSDGERQSRVSGGGYTPAGDIDADVLHAYLRMRGNLSMAVDLGQEYDIGSVHDGLAGGGQSHHHRNHNHHRHHHHHNSAGRGVLVSPGRSTHTHERSGGHTRKEPHTSRNTRTHNTHTRSSAHIRHHEEHSSHRSRDHTAHRDSRSGSRRESHRSHDRHKSGGAGGSHRQRYHGYHAGPSEGRSGFLLPGSHAHTRNHRSPMLSGVSRLPVPTGGANRSPNRSPNHSPKLQANNHFQRAHTPSGSSHRVFDPPLPANAHPPTPSFSPHPHTPTHGVASMDTTNTTNANVPAPLRGMGFAGPTGGRTQSLTPAASVTSSGGGGSDAFGMQWGGVRGATGMKSTREWRLQRLRNRRHGQ